MPLHQSPLHPHISCGSFSRLRYFLVSCAASCIYRHCFFLLLFIYRDAVWLISQLGHSPPPFEASSILILELPVLTCQTCSCKPCQVLSYCIPCMPYLPAAHTCFELQGFSSVLSSSSVCFYTPI